MDLIAITMTMGRSAVELALFVLLPIMVVMLCLMRLIEAAGVLDWLVAKLAPVLRPAGLTGLSLFAMIQVNLVSFAAPLATLALMDRRGASDRHLAATLAMIFAMAQANVLYPKSALGLHLSTTLVVSGLGGIVASAVTFHVIGRSLSSAEAPMSDAIEHPELKGPGGVLQVINQAGAEAFKIAVATIPLVALALVAVAILKETGAFSVIEQGLTPVLTWAGVPSTLIVPSLTKYLGGGTAVLGVMVSLHSQHLIDAHLINASAGWLIHTFDLPGVAILISAGPRVAKVWKHAAIGGVIGIIVRTLIHIAIS
ncbi:MAG: nucleoside recognition domain-containing protein [Pseudomonas sp.]